MIQNSIENSQRTLTNNIYLTKILLFTQNAQSLIEKLRENLEFTVSTNCLNTIGMFPLISRIETSLGTLCMSVWIINLAPRFEQFRYAYYSGASHSIIICENEEELENVADIFTQTPQGVPITIITISDISNVGDINTQIGQRKISYKNITSLEELTNVFQEVGQKITFDIINGEYHTFSPQFVKPSRVYKIYSKKSFNRIQNLINPLGYKLSEDGIVKISKGNFIFEIDFYRNQVKAMIADCLNCKKTCKHYRKLCVVEDIHGYSNLLNLDNLRALAILYSIHEGNFISLVGEKPRENIQTQLQKLQNVYEINCTYYKEEQVYLEQEKTRRKLKKKN